ncbi:MAG TPA: cupin domain-containing protein [Dissulfurispiraceae bacterium]|nr:cupin domain-containing protein [Dissulfurispiraceae bacterium]
MRKKGKTSPPSCDWSLPEEKKPGGNEDRIYRYKGNYRWSGVRIERYKSDEGGWSAISRQVLIGNGGESAKFHLRYFEIAPGGYSSHEQHRHEHVVVCVRGKGKIIIGTKTHAVNHLDTVYVAPDTVHQLRNPYDEPFGFLCIVNARRDRPKLVPFASAKKG